MRPYPYDRWLRVPADEVGALRDAARSFPRPHTARSALASLVGTTVESAGRTFHRCAADEIERSLIDPVACVVLVSPTGPSNSVVVELSPHLAVSIVDRVLGGEGEAEVAVALSDAERGVLAFVAARCIAPMSTGWKVATVMTAPKAVLQVLGPRSAFVWSTGLRVGSCEGVARIWVPQGVTFQADEASTPNLTLPMVLDGGEVVLAAEELLSLRRGDVVVLDENEHWPGRARLRAEGAAKTTWWLKRQSWSVESIEVNEQAARKAKVMSIETNPDTKAAGYEEPTREVDNGMSAVADAPVTLAIELGRLTLSLEEIGKLAEGEVLVSEVRVGEDVQLRAHDRVVGAGQLVDVDGKVGVRIDQLL